MVILYELTVLRRLQTIYVFSVYHTARRRGDTKASAWSRGSRSRNRGIYIAVALKTKFKRHLPGEFHDFSWVFWSRHCSRKGARRARKKKEEDEDDETRFSPFPGSSL